MTHPHTTPRPPFRTPRLPKLRGACARHRCRRQPFGRLVRSLDAECITVVLTARCYTALAAAILAPAGGNGQSSKLRT